MKQISVYLSLVFLCLWLNIVKVNGARWTVEQANDWYKNQPLFFGANFIPSTAVNVIEMWQTFDVNTIERELKWASQINMNIMRVFLHVLLYQQDPQGYLQKLDAYLNIANKYNIKTMFVIFDACWLPNPQLGPQPDPIPGVHNSQWVQCPGQPLLNNATTWPTLLQYIFLFFVELNSNLCFELSF